MVYIKNPKFQKSLRRQLRKNEPVTERLLWSKLRNRKLFGYKFRRQYGIDPFVIDFYCPSAKLAVEIDGDSHYLDKDVTLKDKKRQKYIEDLGIKMLRFTNKDVIENTEGVLEIIAESLTSPNLSFEKERD